MARSYPDQRQSTAEQDFLATLLEAPPASSKPALAPVVLRSAERQRDIALRGFLRRTWVDRALTYAERALVAIAVIVFLAWFADGPVRDWIHEYTTPAKTAVAVPTMAPVAGDAAPSAEAMPAMLPFIPGTLNEQPAEEFLVPGQQPVAKPAAVAPQPSHLIVPAIELDTPVTEVFVQDGVWQVAEYAAGYLHGTALPGEQGNVALAGHAGIRGAVFRRIGDLQPGNDIFLDAGGWRYHYKVRSSTAVWPTQVEVLDPTTTPVLTMLTCTNWDTQRLVVVSDLVGAQPTPES